ncbi:phosphoglycerate dehydrogenase [bacterium AH-315-C07]|nr:phosphoglycerate dehydrogenase [bacterium AH-315-C07]
MKVLIIDSMPDNLITGLTKIGFECVYEPDIDRKAALSKIDAYQGLILRSKLKVDKDFLEKASNLRFIGRGGSGMESIDIKYALKRGVICINAPEGNQDAVAEHTIGMLLSLLNKLRLGDIDIRAGQWPREKNRGYEIKGKTIGIIGYGHMGSAVAQRLSGFDAEIIAYDNQKKKFGNKFVREVGMKAIFKKTDILSLHVPLTPKTEYMINSEFLEKFHKPIYILNTSRGKVVKTSDLIKYLRSGKVLGAALDVLEFEEQSFEKLVADKKRDEQWLEQLLKSNNVLLSPHVAGLTFESWERIGEVLVEKIKALNLIKATA